MRGAIAACLTIAVAVAANTPSTVAAATPSPSPVPQLAGVRGDYVLHCGGCHGINGEVGIQAVAPLRNRIGRLLCSDEGRRFVVRLPNIAHVHGLDDSRLAALLNFMMFDLGGASTLVEARPYTAAEIASLRSAPWAGGELVLRRDAAWRSVATCSGARQDIVTAKEQP